MRFILSIPFHWGTDRWQSRTESILSRFRLPVVKMMFACDWPQDEPREWPSRETFLTRIAGRQRVNRRIRLWQSRAGASTMDRASSK